MIVLYHKENKITGISMPEEPSMNTKSGAAIGLALFELANQYPNEIIAWCHQNLKEDFNISGIEALFNHKKMMFSYHISNGNFLNDSIGYVEESIFIKVNKQVRYPTWQMSGDAGAASAAVLNAISGQISVGQDFDYFLNSLAKTAIRLGLLCYSEPALLVRLPKNPVAKMSDIACVFRFVKSHYRSRWIFLLFVNLAWHERKFPLAAFLKSLLVRRTKLSANTFASFIGSEKTVARNEKIDVLIPTIGRKQYLYDFLTDLSKQAHLPQKVIIVEQNPLADAVSELDYLSNETWPFDVKHVFTHQAGVCNARNLALSEISSDWVFFADDDIRIPADFLENAMRKIDSNGAAAGSFGCYQKGDVPTYDLVFQWPFFGSGCSIVRSDQLTNCRFSKAYEHGFGEDSDFGMQLRNRGCDILYFPTPEILHIKAPTGGFREKPVLAWHTDAIQPKPAPSVMLFMMQHYTKTQIAGYKTNLLVKFYRLQPIKNPFRYYRRFREQWKRSVHWANKLKIVK